MIDLETLATHDFTDRKEAAIREDWIRPLLHHLGYGPGTMNQIEYEEELKLRRPVRLLGSTKFRVDYLPTVLSRGLWLIEAKAPSKASFWDEHLGQAWSYATHPEVNVPLMAIANGVRIAVYDVTRVDWENPVIDLRAMDLSARFNELFAVIGARSVARYIRTTQLERLRLSLRAELDVNVLDETVNQVQRIAVEARPIIEKNIGRVRSDQRQRDASTQVKIDNRSGLWGISQELNGPGGIRTRDVDRALEQLLVEPAARRNKAFQQLTEAARFPTRGASPVRLWGPMRALRLAVALRARHEDGCEEFADSIIRSSVRDHLLDFPLDPVTRAAHRVQRYLPVVLARLLSDPGNANLAAVEEAVRSRVDAESWIRRPVTANGLGRLNVIMRSRTLFNALELTERGSTETAAALTTVVESYPQSPLHTEIFGIEFGQHSIERDELIGMTTLFVWLYGEPNDIPQEARSAVVDNRGAPGRYGVSAADLASRF